MEMAVYTTPVGKHSNKDYNWGMFATLSHQVFPLHESGFPRPSEKQMEVPKRALALSTFINSLNG